MSLAPDGEMPRFTVKLLPFSCEMTFDWKNEDLRSRSVIRKDLRPLTASKTVFSRRFFHVMADLVWTDTKMVNYFMISIKYASDFGLRQRPLSLKPIQKHNLANARTSKLFFRASFFVLISHSCKVDDRERGSTALRCFQYENLCVIVVSHLDRWSVAVRIM